MPTQLRDGMPDAGVLKSVAEEFDGWSWGLEGAGGGRDGSPVVPNQPQADDVFHIQLVPHHAEEARRTERQPRLVIGQAHGCRPQVAAAFVEHINEWEIRTGCGSPHPEPALPVHPEVRNQRFARGKFRR